MERHIVGLSGGKDSTALALRLRELNPETTYEYIYNETGDELPEMAAHIDRMACMLGADIQRVRLERGGAPVGLNELIEQQGCLPSHRIRYCTRMLKIQPTIAYIKRLRVAGDTPVLYVGLRADEETRTGIYGDSVRSVFPFRDWGWGLPEVWGYLKSRGVKVPRRTDCARCYAQRIDEWWRLWKEHPGIYATAIAQEVATGHTFRKANHDTWPVALADLAVDFERGRVPKAVTDAQVGLFGDMADEGACRVCRL